MLLHLVTPQPPEQLKGLGNFTLANLLKNLKQEGLMPKSCIVSPTQWEAEPDLAWLGSHEITREFLDLAQKLPTATHTLIVFDLRRVQGLLPVDTCRDMYGAATCGYHCTALISQGDGHMLSPIYRDKGVFLFARVAPCIASLPARLRQRA